MPTIESLQKELIEELSFLPQWEERYAYLIELGQKMPSLPIECRSEDNIVRGCQSTVWLHQVCQDGKVIVQADSDSLIVKGLVALLVNLYSGQPAEDILQADLAFFEETGLSKHLSSQRTNGLMAMLEAIKAFAANCTAGEF